MDRLYDVAVIGGGPGGYTAALYAARAGLRTLVLEKLSPGGQMASTEDIDNYPGFDTGMDGFELGERMQRGAEHFGAVTEFAEVTALELAAEPRRIKTSSGVFEARAVIIATGASPKKLGVPREEALTGRGVAYCAACDGMRFKDKIAAVAGGGNSAAESALELSPICETVCVVHRRDKLRAEAVYMEALQKAGNVQFFWNARIEALLGDKSLTGLRLADMVTGETKDLACDGLFVAIGRTPETELVKDQLALDKSGYIVADETTRTSVPGVFAVGDVRTKPLRQIVTAAADGAVAVKYVQEYLQAR